MSNIDKRAYEKLKAAASKAVDNFDPNMFVETRDVLALLDELEAKDTRISEQADTIANQDKWIRAIEEAMITSTDRAEAAEKRIAEQRETLLAARSHVMQCARMGDAHAYGLLKAIDRAAGKGE